MDFAKRKPASSLRGATAFAGVGESRVGHTPGISATAMYVSVIEAAVADAGLDLSDVDGLIATRPESQPSIYYAEGLAEYLRLELDLCLTLATGGGTTVAAIQHAATAIACGICDTVVVAMADNNATGLGRDAAIAAMATVADGEFEQLYGPSVPSLYALFATRYMHEYGLTAESIAHVSVTDRYHASLHEGAQYREPISVKDVLASRLIASPLRLLDCAPVSDGGCALVLTSAERARSLRRPPVVLLGLGEAYEHEHVGQAASLVQTAATASASKAYTMAGLGPRDMDMAMIYDAFAFIQCLHLEDLGFCDKGDGPAFVASGATRLGGALPVNTHGGLLSHSHSGRPSALFLAVEAIHQLRHECGVRQVAGATTALVHGEGGILSSHGTLVLAKEGLA